MTEMFFEVEELILTRIVLILPVRFAEKCSL
jgi:hypothetical protein